MEGSQHRKQAAVTWWIDDQQRSFRETVGQDAVEDSDVGRCPIRVVHIRSYHLKLYRRERSEHALERRGCFGYEHDLLQLKCAVRRRDLDDIVECKDVSAV